MGGDEVVGLEVVNVNPKRSRLEIKLTADTRLKSRTPEEREKRQKTTRGAALKDVPAGTKTSSTLTKAAGAPASTAQADGWRTAQANRPVGGWHHTGGRNLAAVQVGELVDGRIT